MADHVFISYCHEDKGYAGRLARSIENEGFSVWIDEQMMVGTKWQDELEEKLEGCVAMVVLASSHSKKSEWVGSEIQHAKDLEKPIIPLLMDSRKPWLLLRPFNCVDVTNGELPPASFYEDLRKLAAAQRKSGADREDIRKRRAAFDKIVAANMTAFRCSKCGFPVTYDTVTALGMILLFGVPAIGAAVAHYLVGWVGAIVYFIAAFALLSILLTISRDRFREPSTCPICGAALRKPLRRYD